MAIITKYVFEKLVNNINTEDILKNWTQEKFEKEVYDKYNLYYFFNNLEKSRLYIYKNLLQNKNLSVYTFIEEQADSRHFVFLTGGKHKYHLDFKCPSIKAKYNYFIVTPEIEGEREDLLETYRGWFKTMKFREQYEEGKISNGTILSSYNKVFAKTHSLKKLNDFNFVEESKLSGLGYTTEYFDLNDFEIKMQQLINDRALLCNNKTMRAIARLDYLLYKEEERAIEIFKERAIKSESFTESFLENYGFVNLKKFWKQHLSIKHKIAELLKSYFRWTYNFSDLAFDYIELEDFGLVCCKYCEKLRPV